MVSFRGQKTPGPRPDWSPLRVSYKISDEHPSPFYMGVLPPGGAEVQYSTPVLSICLLPYLTFEQVPAAM